MARGYGSEAPPRNDRVELLDAVEDDEQEEPTLITRVVAERPSLPDARQRNHATLTMISGPESGRTFSLKEETTFGRSKECSLRVEDASISRLHARIRRVADKYVLEDLQSRNGVFVEGARVERHELQDGDRIQLGASVHLRFAITDDDEERLLRGLYEASTRDPLTGVFNRKHFAERLASEIAYAVRHRTELAIVLIDLDHFKSINDTYGHLAGDTVLRSIAGLVSRTIRMEDVFCRFGGEEFVVIARGIETKGALALAERIRSIVQTSTVVHEGQRIPVTLSAGVATLRCCDSTCTPDRLIGLADERLYQAKVLGRNRVVGPSLPHT